MQILLYEESTHQADVLAATLAGQGYRTVTRVHDKERLFLHATTQQPDMLILQTQSLYVELLDIIRSILETQPIPVVVFTDKAAGDSIEQAVQAGVSAFIVDGLEPRRLVPILEIALARFRKCYQVQLELQQTRKQLEERKIVDRAKGILMKQRGCTEDDAYHALRRMAMENNQRVGEVAKNVVDMAGLLIPGRTLDRTGTVN